MIPWLVPGHTLKMLEFGEKNRFMLFSHGTKILLLSKHCFSQLPTQSYRPEFEAALPIFVQIVQLHFMDTYEYKYYA